MKRLYWLALKGMNPSESICQCIFRPCFSDKNPFKHLLHLRLCPLQKGWMIWKSYTVLSSDLIWISGGFHLASCLMKETWTNSSNAMWITSKQRLFRSNLCFFWVGRVSAVQKKEGVGILSETKISSSDRALGCWPNISFGTISNGGTLKTYFGSALWIRRLMFSGKPENPPVFLPNKKIAEK